MTKRILLFLVLPWWSCAAETRSLPSIERVQPPRPAGQTVAAGSDLQAILDSAPAGATFCLAAGSYAGPLVLKKPVTLWGEPDAVIRALREGTTIAVQAPGCQLLGFAVDGSGQRYDLMDAAIQVTADDVLVAGIDIRSALFGILVEKASRVVLRGNQVRGDGNPALGLRGDSIRLWETHHCRVEANLVQDGRDIVVWYSDHTDLIGNHMRGGRYGSHFMYTRDNRVADNVLIENVVGLFIMYSHDLVVENNWIARCSGAAGIGIGLKESGNLSIRANRLFANTVGIFVDSSPLDAAEHNQIEANEVRMSQVAVMFHGRAERNRITDNSFRDNHAQVRVDGGGSALAAKWEGNVWDDYQGYDLDGDGFGDLPYQSASLANQLTSQHKDLAFFQGTPTLALVEITGRVMPIFAPKPLLQDPRPRTRWSH